MEIETPIFFFFTFFLTVYLFSYHIIFKNWTSKSRPEAASCAISLFHGTPALFFASFSLLSQTHLNFASLNSPLQNTTLDYSISYFAMDLINYLLFYPGDLFFIAHHLATLFVFTTCRYLVGHGAVPILVLLVLAEVTSALQNAWTLAGARRFENEIAAKVFNVLSPPFYALYTVARGFLGPAFVYKMLVFFVGGGGDGVIPRWIWCSWIVVVVMAISGSLLWVSNLWAELFRERHRALGKKER